MTVFNAKDNRLTISTAHLKEEASWEKEIMQCVWCNHCSIIHF